jgi:hypothetical protein
VPVEYVGVASDFWIALTGGAIGSLLTAVIGFGVRASAIPGEVEENDWSARERNDDLESWVSDRTRRLRAELATITDELNARNLFYSGAHASALARAKELALHEYRDQERQARRDIAAIRGRERWMHRLWRRLKRLPLPELTADSRVKPVLDAWRSSVIRHGDPPVEVHDPTRRLLDYTLSELAAAGTKDYV